MNVLRALKISKLFVCILAAAFCMPVTESKTDEPDKAEKPTADSMRGKAPGEVRDDNGLKMKIVWCPPGEFTMGSPASEEDRDTDEEQVQVTLTKGFWLGKHEVSQAEWKQLMQTEPWKGEEFTKEGDEFPATNVGGDDAEAFCRKLTEQERRSGRLPAEWEYTLPTEAQWERACRAGTKTMYSFGDDKSKLGEFAWFNANAEQVGEMSPLRIGQKKPNPWGLCDMHGNLWEFCRDWYVHKLLGGRDPEVSKVKAEASSRVVRGGGWSSGASGCRSANRSRRPPAYRNHFLGFRVALSSI